MFEDATRLTRNSKFPPFATSPCVRFLRVRRIFTRAELAYLETVVRPATAGRVALAWVARNTDGNLLSPIVRHLSQAELNGLAIRDGETLLFFAGSWADTANALRALEEELAREDSALAAGV